MKLQKTTKGIFFVFPEYEQHAKTPNQQFRFLVEDLDEYIGALKTNFQTYQRRKLDGENGIYTGLKGMTINLEGPYEGVCLFEHYRPIKTQEQLDRFIKELKETC